MAELGVAGGAVGIISLGIQVCQGLIQYYGSWKDAPKNVAQMCRSVQNLEETLKVLKVTIKDKGVATRAETGVQSSIDACTVSINELQGELIRVQEVKGSSIWSKVHGQGRRLLYPFRESTLLRLEEIVAEIRENLSLAVDVLHLQGTANTGEQLEYVSTQVNDLVTFVRSHHNDQESRAIINWLSPLNFFAAQNDNLRRRQDGTGEWLFETSQFEAWLAGTDRILWCSGLPGAGKTILASAIVDKLQTQLSPQNVGLAFVYCNYKERGSQTLANLIGSLVQQLVQCHSTITDEVRALYTQYNSKNIRPSEEEFSRILQSLIVKFSHVYVVVDALDECNPKTRSKFIEKLQESPANLHLLCTSRHLGDIQEAFAEASHLEIRASDSDVARYLKAQIVQVPKLVKFCKKAVDLQGSIIEKLVEKAKGMFLLAELHLESLKTKTDVKSLRKALDVLPEERDKTYKEALERIQRQPEDESKLAMRVLSWITHAIRPLKVGEIQHAIAVMNFEPDDTTLDEEGLTDEAELITVCGGIAVIDQNSRVIRLVHYTTEEYFERHRSKIFPTAQVDILCACIRYLSMDPFKDGPCTTDMEMENRLKNYELIEYTSHHWGTYACGDLDDTIEEQVLRFLDDGSLLSSAVQTMSMSGYRYGSSWSQKYSKGVPGIVVAAGFGLTRLVDKTLRLGNSIEGNGSDGWTALHGAARSGHEPTVQLLLEKGADVEAKDQEGWTALLRAAWNGDEAVVQLLLEKGADVEAKEQEGWTALFWAAWNWHQAVVQLLLEKGADIEAKDHEGWTALHWVAEDGREAVVQLLLEKGADVKAKDQEGWTALFRAAWNGHKAVVQLLLEKGADIEAKDHEGWTALFWAAWDGHEAIVQQLLEKGADIEAKDHEGRTVLHQAAEGGREAVVQLLLEKGADVEAKDQEGWTALFRAAWNGHEAVVQLLLEKGADIEAKDHEGRTVLHRVAEDGREVVVQLLLEKGADVKAKDQEGWTALFRAAWNGHEAVVQLLLGKGADVKAKDQEGWTALHRAAENGYEAVI